jgi:transposase
MPTGRLNMRRIRDVLRLKFGQGLSERDIAVSLGLGKGSVGAYVRRAQRAQLSWPLSRKAGYSDCLPMIQSHPASA